jgi:hypothetical protein
MNPPRDFQVPAPPKNAWQGFRYCRDPRLLAFHFRHVRKRVEFVAALTGSSSQDVQRAISEVEHDTPFLKELMGKHLQHLGRAPRATDLMYLAVQAGSPYFFLVAEYAVVRLLAPGLILETGGTPGNSSAFLLRALARNGKGRLVTVDMPPTDTVEEFKGPEGLRWHAVLPEGKSSGWAIPEDLREQHQLVLGDAKHALPDLLAEASAVDIFIHDSDHSYDHMHWEFEQVWPVIRPGGLLLSDDILGNSAFDDFVNQYGAVSHKLGNLGGIVKPPD